MSVKQSQYDPREYRTLVLSNCLAIMLVSDPDITVSGASMCVGVGTTYERYFGR